MLELCCVRVALVMMFLVSIVPGEARAVGELIELLLTARDADDQQIPAVGGIVDVEIGEPFLLEVSYNELRLSNDRLGAFALYTDLVFSQAGLVPILNETQRLIIGGEIRGATSGTLTFGIEGSATTYVSDFVDFANDPLGEVVNALAAFGYVPEDYRLTTLDFGNDDLGYQIHYGGDGFGDVDVPDLFITPALDVAVPTQTIEFAPREADGVTPNAAAVRFNLDTRSRTFNDNERFYDLLNRGDFDPDSGFSDLGGVGPIPLGGGGIPELTDDGGFITPFDAFSIRVRFPGPSAGVTVSVEPGTDPDAVLLYGRADPVPFDMVLLEEGASLTVRAVPEPSGQALGLIALLAGGLWSLARGAAAP